MSDEIKEILNYLKIENGHCSSELSYEETHILLDYITNLQQENDRLENIIDEIEYFVLSKYSFDEFGMKIIDRSKLQDKIHELKENNNAKD